MKITLRCLHVSRSVDRGTAVTNIIQTHFDSTKLGSGSKTNDQSRPILPQTIFARAQSPIEKLMVRVPLLPPPPTGIFINHWCAIPNHHHHHHRECSVQGQVLHCKCRKLGCSSVEGRFPTANSGTKTKAAVLPGTGQVRQFPVAFRTPISLQHLNKQKDLKRSQRQQTWW